MNDDHSKWVEFQRAYIEKMRPIWEEQRQREYLSRLEKDRNSESYIIRMLIKGTNLNEYDIRRHPELIEAQRINLKIKRELKQNNQNYDRI